MVSCQITCVSMTSTEGLWFSAIQDTESQRHNQWAVIKLVWLSQIAVICLGHSVSHWTLCALKLCASVYSSCVRKRDTLGKHGHRRRMSSFDAERGRNGGLHRAPFFNPSNRFFKTGTFPFIDLAFLKPKDFASSQPILIEEDDHQVP